MKKIIFILFVFLSTLYQTQIYAQIPPTPSWTWAKNIEGVSVVIAGDDGSLFTDTAGNSYIVNQINNKVNIKKYDAMGALVWNRTGSSGSGIEKPTDITVDANGNYYVTGSYTGAATFGTVILTSTARSDLFIVKFNAAGNVIWAKNSGEATTKRQGNSIAVDSNGNCYVGGYNYDRADVTPEGTFPKYYYVKFDPNGTKLWEKYSGSSSSSIISITNTVNGISVDNFGNSYITGYNQTSSTNTQPLFFIQKNDPSGNTVWKKTRTEISAGNAIVTDGVGNSYVTGTLYSTTTNYDIFTTKYDAAGRVVWTKTTGGSDRDYGDGIAIDANENCYISGRFQSNATFGPIAIENLNSGISDIFVAKYDNLGDIVWVQQAGESGEDEASKIGVDSAGNCYINGFYATRTTFGNTTLSGIIKQPFLARIGDFIEGPESITTLPLASRNYNAGSAISVSFTTKGTFPEGTTFTVELSDPTGSFFYPKYIGVGLTSPINCVIPSLTIPASDYRIRVISSNPTVLGTDNGSAITINGNSQLTTPDWSWAKNVDSAPAVNTFDNGSIFTDTAGNSYIVNQINNKVNIKKYDAMGALVWNRTGSSGSGIETPKDIAADNAGNYYVTGSFTGTSTFGSTTLTNNGQSDIFIVKYNASGTVVWAQNYGINAQEQANSIAVDADGNIYIGGFSHESNSFIYLFYAKYNSSGVSIWKKTGAGSNSTFGTIGLGLSIRNEVKGISFDSFGNTYITGSVISSSTSYAFIIKCDPSGNTVWQKQRTEFSVGNDIVTDSVGNSYVTGAYFASESGFNVFVTKYNAAGVLIWTQEGIGLDNDYGDGIALDAEGNCFITGRFQHNTDFSTLNISNTSSGISDVFVAKYDKFGSIIWLQQAGESGQDAGSKIGVDGEGNCYINGYYSANTTFGATTLNGVNFNPFLAKIGVTAATTLVNAVVKGGNFCGGAVVTVDFAITGKYDGSNVFTAQLSDASGSFINPTDIGTLNSPNNTSIYAILPLETLSGTGYRIRVISSNPSLIGNDNGIDIKINQTDCKDNVVKLSESPIAAIEYFIDNDPGIGKGTSLNTTGGLTVSDNFSISLPSLTAGFHNLFVRYKNADGIWSMYEGRVFYVQPVALTLESSPIVAAEYFFDDEPGIGKGTALSSISSGNPIGVTVSVPTSGLSGGFHNLFIRTKDAKGKWGMYEGRVVYLQPTLTSSVIEPIVAAEYFFNADPGIGKGTLINTGDEVNELTLNIPNIATNPLQNGDQNVFIRVKNKAGKWSLSEQRKFTICGNVLGSPIVTGSATICVGNTLQLTAGNVTGATSYKWTGPNNFTATTQSITINSVSALNAGEYSVVALSGTTSCDVGNPTKINVTVSSTLAPEGESTQSFESGTLANLQVNGTNVKWYASASDASSGTNPLPLSTILVNSRTYYATQTLNGCESKTSLAVTVTVTLDVNEFDLGSFKYYPNPVTDILTLSNNVYELQTINIFDSTGKLVFKNKLNSNVTNIDMSSFANGLYLLELFYNNSKKYLKIIKK